MSMLLNVVLPVFLVIGFGYVAIKGRLFSNSDVDALMKFTQNFAIPALLFRAISTLDLAQSFNWALLASFYAGATAGFLAGLLGARFLFHRPWEECVAIGFCGLFSNTVLLGLPITERAYGASALAPNYAIISVHSLYGYTLGITVMEAIRANGRNALATARSVVWGMVHNPLLIGLALGFAVNLSGLALPGVLSEAVDMMVTAALPAALFGLGGVLARYRIAGDLPTVAYICAVSLFLHPALTWGVGRALHLTPGEFRSAVLTAAMAPGVNAYIFANMYGVAKRVAASAVLIATIVSLLSITFWLSVLA